MVEGLGFREFRKFRVWGLGCISRCFACIGVRASSAGILDTES